MSVYGNTFFWGLFICASQHELSDFELFILDIINVCELVRVLKHFLCLLICLSANQLIRRSCSVTMTFSVSVLVGSHFAHNAVM